MKLTTFFAATFAVGAIATSAAQAAGVVFNTPVTYTEPVTYAAGVTYLAPVTYSQTAATEAQARAAAAAVMLDRVIVTPSRTYGEQEWHMHLASQKERPQLYPVRSERRLESGTHSRLRIFLPFQ